MTTPTVVLLHAFPLDARMWQPQTPALAGCSVWAPNLPGPALAPDLAAWADWLIAAVPGPTVWVGLSLGGYVALEVVRRAPELVAGLVLADTHPYGDSSEVKAARNQQITRLNQEGSEFLAQSQPERLLGPTTRGRRPALAGQVSSWIRQNSAADLATALLAMGERQPATELLPQIDFPTLVIGGQEDQVSPPELLASYAELIPTGRHLVIPQAGHLSNLEAPLAFNTALLGILAEVYGLNFPDH